MIDRILEYLSELVACDTQNPPRQIATNDRLFDFLNSVCGGNFKIDVREYGEGRIAWHACRGAPRVLFNVHLDTVPAGSSWESNPHQLHVADGRAIGLGACDIKGAAACLLALARSSDIDLGLLFTTDEEGGNPCAVDRFIASVDNPPQLVVVAEPTRGNAVLGHRGYVSQSGTFRGRSGHTSLPAGERASAVHKLIDWSATALREIAAAEKSVGQEVDFCFNLGAISGGVKGNMVAEQATLRWSARPPSGCDVSSLLSTLARLPHGEEAQWETTFLGASFPSTVQLRQKAEQWVARLALPIANDVDFWTEAARFSQAGWPCLVLGPGDISQAHAAGEWVALDQLQLALDHYSRIAHVDEHP